VARRRAIPIADDLPQRHLLGGAPDWVVIAMFVVLTGTTGMLTGVALVSGLVWAAWRYPITAVVYRDAGLPSWFCLLRFTFVDRQGVHKMDRRRADLSA
jgi:hypothetical protein